MFLSAVSAAFVVLTTTSGDQTGVYNSGPNQLRQQPINGDPVFRQVTPSIATLMSQNVATGSAALIDVSGLYMALKGSVIGNEMEARFSNGQTGHLRVISQDGCTQLVLLRSDYVPPGARAVSLSATDVAPGTPLLVVVSSGTIRARLESTDAMGVVKPSNRVLPLSEIRFETPIGSLGGALIFTEKGEFLGVLNATLMRRAPAFAMKSSAAAPSGFGGGGAGGPFATNQSQGGGRSVHDLAFRGNSYPGPGELTVAYTPSLDVVRKVIDGFTSPDHEVEHPSIGVFCRDGVGGALVQSIQDDSPAAKAGLKPGDMLIGIANFRVRNQIDFAKVMFRQKPGEKVMLRIDRGGRWIQRAVLIGKTTD